MGSLRTIFAIAVVFSHCWPEGIVFVGGRNAVQLFYIISGFLISFVLVEKKTYDRVRYFYLNRYLRLYPIYISTAAITLTVFSIAHFVNHSVPFFDVYATAPASATTLL